MDTPKVINKVKVSDKMTLSVAIFNEGSPEQFLNHVQTSLEKISQREMDTDYQEACKADLKAEEKLLRPLRSRKTIREQMKIILSLSPGKRQPLPKHTLVRP